MNHLTDEELQSLLDIFLAHFVRSGRQIWRIEMDWDQSPPELTIVQAKAKQVDSGDDGNRH